MLEKPLLTRWESVGKALEKCWNLPVERKSVSVRFPVRGHNCLILGKIHRKLFSNFTRHHLITNANLLLPFSSCLTCTTQYSPRKFSAERGPTEPRNGNSRFIRSQETTTKPSTVQTTLCRPVICRLDICRTATCRPEIKYCI